MVESIGNQGNKQSKINWEVREGTQGICFSPNKYNQLILINSPRFHEALISGCIYVYAYITFHFVLVKK